MKIDLNPELEELIKNISQKNLYYGNRIPDSIIKQFEIVESERSAGILVPFWLPVVERGRGPRRKSKDHGLVYKIYDWMRRRNMFRSATDEGRMREARFVTWYINKYGNKQFRSKVFVDVYTTERQKTMEKIYKKYGIFISEITKQVI
jgi:hypothetical protein